MTLCQGGAGAGARACTLVLQGGAPVLRTWLQQSA